MVAKGDTVVALAQPGQGDGSRVVSLGRRRAQLAGDRLPAARGAAEARVAGGDRRRGSCSCRRGSGRSRATSASTARRPAPSGRSAARSAGWAATSPGVESLVPHASGVAAVSQASLGGYAVLTQRGRPRLEQAGRARRPGGGDAARRSRSRDAGTLFAGGDQAAADVDNQLVLMAVPPGGKASRVRLGPGRGPVQGRPRDQPGGRPRRQVRRGRLGFGRRRHLDQPRTGRTGGPSASAARACSSSTTSPSAAAAGWRSAARRPGLQVTEPLLVTSRDGRQWKKVADLRRPRAPR